ncbi:hypothetical protein TrST_g3200 [Triparma strigata]|uniref:uroporphyrinogen-III C-methyltransferase n=1 Tax=Triparma strigata TaxID=1606541 RepID=A0A9W7E867_9STRA|nr:hypothetical protein TrST_g3200 [Triparma strigata]
MRSLNFILCALLLPASAFSFLAPPSRFGRPVSRLFESPVEVIENPGTLTLLGAGPGDPNLLTLKALSLLSDPSTLVVSDRLVSQPILDLVAGNLLIANKNPGCADLAQNEIYNWCMASLSLGKNVIRLKIGDPFIFGRGGEEVLYFRERGIDPVVVPGISASLAAPLLGGIPLTHRGVSNQIVICTGYGREGTSPDLIRYHPEQTVVFLMAIGRLRSLSQRLMEMAGYPGDTEVGIVEKAGCEDQRTLRGNLNNIADLAEEYEIVPPSTIVVGGVCAVLESGMLEKKDGLKGLDGTVVDLAESKSVEILKGEVERLKEELAEKEARLEEMK